jgi:hypothetical protein
MKDDIKERRLNSWKTMTYSPLLKEWLSHPNSSTRETCKSMRTILVKMECHPRYLERAYREGGIPRIKKYLHSLNKAFVPENHGFSYKNMVTIIEFYLKSLKFDYKPIGHSGMIL